MGLQQCSRGSLADQAMAGVLKGRGRGRPTRKCSLRRWQAAILPSTNSKWVSKQVKSTILSVKSRVSQTKSL